MFPLHVLAADKPFYEGDCESLVVPTLDGDVEMNIPAGSSSGRRLRIRGRGLGPATGRGDEYVTVAISVPKPEDLTEEQLKHWKALAGQK